MAHQELSNRIKSVLEVLPGEFAQKKMFGGIAFLYKGKMTLGVINNDLMVRVVSKKMEGILHMEHVRPMDFTGKPMKEFIFVAEGGYRTEEQLRQWSQLGLEHAKNKLREH